MSPLWSESLWGWQWSFSFPHTRVQFFLQETIWFTCHSDHKCLIWVLKWAVRITVNETCLFWVRGKPSYCPRRYFAYWVLWINFWVIFEVRTLQMLLMKILKKGLLWCDGLPPVRSGLLLHCRDGTVFQCQEFQVVTHYGPDFMGDFIQDVPVCLKIQLYRWDTKSPCLVYHWVRVHHVSTFNGGC